MEIDELLADESLDFLESGSFTASTTSSLDPKDYYLHSGLPYKYLDLNTIPNSIKAAIALKHVSEDRLSSNDFNAAIILIEIHNYYLLPRLDSKDNLDIYEIFETNYLFVKKSIENAKLFRSYVPSNIKIN
jgi:hypothetical protein